MEKLVIVLSLIPPLFAALIPIFMLLPGSEPEKTMQKIVDLITKYSRK